MKQKLIYLILALFISSCTTSIKKQNPQSAPPQHQNISPVAHKKCINYEAPIQKAVRANNFKQLEKLLAKLNQQPDCPISFITAVKRSMAQIAAARADELTQQGNLTKAKTWLKRAPTMVWGTQVVYGDIAARRKQWLMAAQFYKQTLDLIVDPQATPKQPPQELIKKVHQLTASAQILAGRVQTTVSLSRKNLRGVQFNNLPISIPFASGKITLDQKGQQLIQQLATYLKQYNITQVNLCGHTDSNGSHIVNDKISKQRALAVKKYLQKYGVMANINVIGKGEREPLQLTNRALYSSAEIDTLNRRVELIAKL